MKAIIGKCSLGGGDDGIAMRIDAPGEFEAYIASCRHPLECTYGTKPEVYPYLVVVEYDDDNQTKACTFITPDMFEDIK